MSEEGAVKLHDDLIANGLLIPTGVRGVFGKSARFEDVLLAFENLVSRICADDEPTRVHFPPVLPREVLRRTGYMENFPQLCGSVHSFTGNDQQQAALVDRVNEGGDWGEFLSQTEVTLCPSACYPLYPTLSGSLPAGGRLFDLCSYVFRHEPSLDPCRMQIFRMRENIRIGSQDEVVSWRNQWVERGLSMARRLGLRASTDLASDPFFGRGGRMMGKSQKEQELKFELLYPIVSEEKPTAIASFNYHQDHYGKTFDIRLSNGERAQSACMGFGLERTCLALFKTHGMNPSDWPESVKKELWP